MHTHHSKLTFMQKDMRGSSFIAIYVLVLFFFSNLSSYVGSNVVQINKTSEYNKSMVHIGVVIDLNSPMGSMADLCMEMALSDFYSAHPNYKTRLKLHLKSAESVLDANFAVLDLLKDEEVQGILGPQNITEETFLAELGAKVHVPIISFTARSPTHSLTDNPYFVRSTLDDAVQAKALAAICKGFEWPDVVVLYEDTDYGNRFLSHINNALQEIEVGLAYIIAIPTSIDDRHLLKELEKLATKQARTFLVHMNPSLGDRLFVLAKRVGVMSEGYAWIISDSLSNFMNSMNSVTRDSMEGVIGVRPYVNHSKELNSFQERWKRNMLLKNTTGAMMELNVYGLWAYDAVTALAMAVEKIGPLNSTSFSLNPTNNVSDNVNLRISTFGPRLLNELSRTEFRGLAGDFGLVDGKLKLSAYEIFNVVGSGEKTIGFWTPNKGIAREYEIDSVGERPYSTSMKELKKVTWPGDSTTRPKGWAIPATGKLRVGIPWKRGFTEFVNVTVDPETNRTVNATGFAIDIFLAALNGLPFPIEHEFHHYNDTTNSNWTYDDLLHEVPQSKIDMVVGDTTVWAPRADYVDFSLPYSESGVILVVKNRKPFDMWIFIKPLRWDLWLAIFMSCFVMGIVLHILERRVSKNGDNPLRPRKEKPGMIYWSPVTVLAFPERNMVSNNWSLFVLVFWLFMAFILMQSYTANLSAILTVDQLKFAFSDNYNVGYQEASFMKQFLMEQLHITETRLKSYNTVEEYHDAMSRGSKRGGVDAIFDEVPYMKIFLNKYDSQYKMVGPTYRTGGFGFAFPVGSPLTSHFSKAILDVTQGSSMTTIERQNFGPGYSSLDPQSSMISQGASSLTLYDFVGLFLIVGSVTIFSLFCSETPIGRKITKKVSGFIQARFHFNTPEVVSSTDVTSVGGDSTEGSGQERLESALNNVSDSSPGEGIEAQNIEHEMHEISASNGTSVPQDIGVGIENNGEKSS